MSTLIQAVQFATKAHAGQKRKYIDEAYIHHPLRVMNWVLIHPSIPGNREVAAMAAVLHDVVEDCDVTLQEIRDLFGADVALIVDGLTNVFIKADFPGLNRKARKWSEAARLGECCPEVKIIKMFDLIDNLRSCCPLTAEMMGFALTFAEEAEYLCKRLRVDDPCLRLELYNLTTSLRFDVEHGPEMAD